MLIHPQFDPVAFQIGFLKIHWYGLSYLTGFMLAFLDCYHRRAREPRAWSAQAILDLISYLAFGLIFGGRLGYLLFYETPSLWQNPLNLLAIWEPGRSFHGALLGAIVGVYCYARQQGRTLWSCLDFIAPSVPLGLLCGRLGNFINGELWGRTTSLPWAMVFPEVDGLARHPSQLYEALGEGLGLYLLLKLWSHDFRLGVRSGVFLLGYGLIRIAIECVRAPDPQIHFTMCEWLTMGQILSVPMVVFGIWLLRNKHATIS